MSPVLIAAVAAVIVVPIVITVVLKGLYKVPAADQALIITGGGTKGQTAGTEGRTYKIVTGGGALVIRSGGGRVGQSFPLRGERMTIGRSPDSEIFLDDVTVSRRHAEFRRSATGFTVSDVGSLNGTYVNRDRIDSVELNDGDEVQIGKYRLVFFSSHPNS